MEIMEEKINEVYMFRLNGSLDSNTSTTFEDKMMEAIQKGANKIVVDFGAVEYISSAGLRVLNKASKKLKHSEGRIILCRVEDYIKEVFEIAGFHHFLPIVSTVDDAMAGF
ncbi:MAG: STAS domain-containing protein [Pseudomonadota bacterium]